MINPSTEWWRARKAEEVPLEHLPDAGHDEVRVQRLLDQEQLREVLPLLGERQLGHHIAPDGGRLLNLELSDELDHIDVAAVRDIVVDVVEEGVSTTGWVSPALPGATPRVSTPAWVAVVVSAAPAATVS
ncbi:hypothetical protein [Streptomyces sp. NPDC059010]|uniref:hypothetical protein n=1 Tax=Streptomyces sp. NPDC059010 TaxID=3346695 RepID=UPI0036D093B8